MNNGHIIEMIRDINRLKIENAALKIEISKIDLKIGKTARNLHKIKPEKFVRYLKSVETNIHELHHRLAAMIERVTVATELDYYCRQKKDPNAELIREIVIRTFDKPDQWWLDRRTYSLGRWYDFFLQQGHEA
ncbi:hypothetical protein [Methylohalobius crimeensis]|uniref:hypothetical protein n=1 Tax=Methylohalobius crimeensis TaxID=244365 RepID=UPI0003B3D36A|nr:hypothetical protein [Methylohalobius crimeensis]